MWVIKNILKKKNTLQIKKKLTTSRKSPSAFSNWACLSNTLPRCNLAEVKSGFNSKTLSRSRSANLALPNARYTVPLL